MIRRNPAATARGLAAVKVHSWNPEVPASPLMDPPSLRRALFGPAWSIVAPGRSGRPRPVEPRSESAAPVCPFCEGNESETAREVFALRGAGTRPDRPGWTVRVVPNKYPALVQEMLSPTVIATGPHEALPAMGFHEVVIDVPEHDSRLTRFSLRQLETALAVYRSRLLALSTNPTIRSMALFRNDGRAAGASQDHPHSQILALPVVPTRLQHELDSAEAYFRTHHRCVTCNMLQQDLLDTRRLVAQNTHFAAVTSFTPRFPYETWVVPISHAHDFRECDTDQIRSLAAMLKRVMAALEATLGTFPFNLVLHTAPIGDSRATRLAFHWRLEILPRLTIPSGFELGHGVFIVSVPPEDAADRLRSSVLPEAGG